MGYNKDLEIENKFKPKILHLLAISRPDLSGYSIRSHDILKFQKNYYQIYALTEPVYIKKRYPDIIENIPYLRYPPNKGSNIFFNPKIKKLVKKAKFYNSYYNLIFKNALFYLEKIFNSYKPDIIHVHASNFYGHYVSKLIKKIKIPFVFEVRGLIEDTHVGLGILREGSFQYRKSQEIRKRIIKNADVIVTLGNSMKSELIRQGINADKIKIVPNGVNIKKLHPKSPNLSIKEKLGIKNEKLLGYIGSIRRIEGIEVLLKALKIVKKEINNILLLLVGPGDPIYINELKDLAKKFNLHNNIKFIGAVPNSEIEDYYSILDICIIPRLNLRVNQLVTPLKPLEVMAMGKTLIVSNLPALRELVKPGISGDLFQVENVEDLVNKIKKYLFDQNIMDRLGKSAREYVKENYDWRKVITKYNSLYEKLFN